MERGEFKAVGCFMDLKTKTEDELKHLLREIREELDNRQREPAKRVYAVTLNDLDPTWFKDINEAIKELRDEATEDTIAGLSNKVSIEPIDIPESEYNLRPDRWYG